MKILKIFLLSLLIIAFAIKAEATDISDEISSSINNEFNEFKDSLPNNVKDFLPNEVLNGDFSTLTNSEIDEGSLLTLALDYLISELDTVIKSFASILALLLIIGAFNSLAQSFSSSTLINTFSICSVLSVAITVFNICQVLVTRAVSYVKTLCSVMNAFIPIMITLLIMSGNTSSAVVSNTSMVLFINIIESFLIVSMLPLIKMCLSFSCVKSLSNGRDLTRISKTAKNTFTSVTVFVMSVFMFVLSYKSTLSQSADSLSQKAVKFAISSFVPLVGSSVNDAMRTVSSSLSYIKNSCGIIAIIAIAVIMLPIIVNLFLNKLSFNILASVAQLVNADKESLILDEADSCCGFLLTIVACTCVLFIFSLTIFIKTEVNLIS